MPVHASPPDETSSRKTVSVALATYNGASFIAEQLASIATQTLLPDELVIFDDASSDETVEICQQFSQTVPFRVRIEVASKNEGYVRNFERALMACKGDYVFLCDQDDAWYPEKIEVMVHLLDVSPSKLLAIHDLRYCDLDLRPTRETKLGRFRILGGIEKNYVTGMATVIRRDLLNLALPLPDADLVTHDSWLHECALSLECKLIVDVVLAKYRRHQSNATSENYLNSEKVNSRNQIMRLALRASARRQVAARLQLFEGVGRWLLLHRKELVRIGLASSERVSRKIIEYERSSELARRRLKLLEVPRLRRGLPVLANWLRGGYKPFSGFKSAAKDLISG